MQLNLKYILHKKIYRPLTSTLSVKQQKLNFIVNQERYSYSFKFCNIHYLKYAQHAISIRVEALSITTTERY